MQRDLLTGEFTDSRQQLGKLGPGGDGELVVGVTQKRLDSIRVEDHGMGDIAVGISIGSELGNAELSRLELADGG